MSTKKYADTDFFLALLKDSDWLKDKAKKLYEKHRQELWVTPFTIVEVMIVCVREHIPLKETLYHMSRIAGTTAIKWQFYFRTAEYIEKGATLFDSLLMSYVTKDTELSGQQGEIISSDVVYEKFGFRLLDLKK